MAKIPFDIKYRPQIESGEYKVETRNGRTARVVCWDRFGTQLVALIGKEEDVLTYNPDGTMGQMSLPSDLFIVTPEKDLALTLEQVVKLDNIIMNMVGEGYNNGYKTRPFYEEVLKRFNEIKKK